MIGYIERDSNGIQSLSYNQLDTRSFVIYDVDEDQILTPCSMNLRSCLLYLLKNRYTDANMNVRVVIDTDLECYSVEEYAILPLKEMAETFIQVHART